jgi:hypothetical protein
LTSRVFTERVKKPRSWASTFVRLFTCRCRRREADDEHDVQCFVLQRINPITDEPEDFYPWILYSAKLFVSTVFMLAWVAGVIVLNLLILELKASYYTDPNDTSSFAPYWQSAIGVLLGVSMKVLHTLYLISTETLLTWENHRTESAWNNAKIVKTFCFSFVNSYFSLFYMALTVDESLAANQLATQLVSVMISRTATGLVVESLLPFLVFAYMRRTLEKHKPKGGEEAEEETQTATQLPPPARTAAVHDSSTLPAVPPVPSSRRTGSVSITRVAPDQHTDANGNAGGSGTPATSAAVHPRVQAWPDSKGGAETKDDIEAGFSASSNVSGVPVVRDSKRPPSLHDAAGAASAPLASSRVPDLASPIDSFHAGSSGSQQPVSFSPGSSGSASVPDGVVATAPPLSWPVHTNDSLGEVHHDAQLEIQRPAAPSLLDNYLEIVTQIGYVTCFSAVFPAAPLLVILSLGLIGHGLLYKYLHVAQRPIQERAADIGASVKHAHTYARRAMLLCGAMLCIGTRRMYAQLWLCVRSFSLFSFVLCQLDRGVDLPQLHFHFLQQHSDLLFKRGT